MFWTIHRLNSFDVVIFSAQTNTRLCINEEKITILNSYFRFFFLFILFYGWDGPCTIFDARKYSESRPTIDKSLADKCLLGANAVYLSSAMYVFIYTFARRILRAT